MVEIFYRWMYEILLFLLCAICVIPGELISGPEKQSWASRIRGAVFYAIYVFFIIIGVYLARLTIEYLGPQALFRLQVPIPDFDNQFTRLMVVLPAALIGPIVSDVAYYWFHRLQHTVPFLWRFHSVHHSIEEMSVTNCHHHWSEGLWQAVLLILPMAFVLDLKAAEIGIVTSIVGVWALFVHTNSRIDFGPFRYLVVSPAFHRVHHSMDKKHHDKNFAGLCPLPDILFGTAVFPDPNETIKTGLADKHEPRTLKEFAIRLRDR